MEAALNKLLMELEGEGLILSQPLKNNKAGYTQNLEQIVRLAWAAGYTTKILSGDAKG